MTCKKAIIAVLLLCFACSPIYGEDVEYISITNPFLRKIPIAVTTLKSFSDTAAEMETARQSAAILSKALTFTKYFKLLDPAAFIEKPAEKGIRKKEINFTNWSGIGAEMLITGGIAIKSGILNLELRLFDTVKMTMIVGKRYKGRKKDLREMLHRFCSDVLMKLIGDPGVFGSKIAFVSNTTGSKEIYTCEFDGFEPRRFTNYRSISINPAWSADGKWLAFTSFYKNGKPDIIVKSVKGRIGSIIARKGVNVSPAWVPKGFQLAAALSYSGDAEIYLLTGRGKIIKRLTVSNGIDVSPSWSPDGRRFAFVSRRSGTPQIYVGDSATTYAKRLTYSGTDNQEPCWSPKGDKIAFTSSYGSGGDIYVIGADGENLMQLTQDSGYNESPSWSPDGSLIVFASDRRKKKSKIYVMTAFGTEQQQLVFMKGAQSNPAWSRVIDK